MRRLLVAGSLALTLSGCGYFNSLYNANRHYAEGERAAARGEGAAARTAWLSAIDKAAVSYRGHPDGRWSDDALLLIGKARFALEQDAEAVAAMRHVLLVSRDQRSRGVAAAWLGAALVRSDSSAAALTYLTDAAASLDARTDPGAFARLWRARAFFALDRPTDAWPDLGLAVSHRTTSVEAAMTMVGQAVELRDSARLKEAAARLATNRAAAPLAGTLENLLREAASAWSPAVVLHATAPLDRTAWPADAANRLGMTRANIAMQAGDVPYAVSLVTAIAQTTSGGEGSRARLLAARWRLADARSLDDLEDVQRMLAAAYDNPDAVDLLRSTRALQLLASRGTSPAGSLSLFAAAELANDLGAPPLAATLFLEFAGLAPDSPWAGKAVLAAHALAPDPRSTLLLQQLASSPYVRNATNGAAAGEVDLAEQRLARGIHGLRAEALAEVLVRGTGVNRAISVLDSTRAAARSDSVRIACGLFVDSAGVSGTAGDSLRVACLRGDSTRVASLIRADSAARADSLQAARARARQLPPDTILPRRP